MKKETLKELYLIQKLSQEKIAKKLACSQSSVSYYLNKYSIKRNQRNIETSTLEKICPSCKIKKLLTDFYMRSSKGRRGHGSWCKKCMNAQVLKRQRAYKAAHVKRKGGCCQACGFDKYDGALEFHHVDPSQKDNKMGKMAGSSNSPKVQAELAKCVLLCSNCHKMVHANIVECPKL
jgi:predicted transcriptional regulator